VKSIKELVAGIPIISNEWHVRLLSQWPNIIGSLAPNVVLESIQDTAVVLSVSNSAWLQELHCLSPMIIARINQIVGSDQIRLIRFKNKSVKRKFEKQTVPIQKKDHAPLFLLPREELVLAQVSDHDLQFVLKQFRFRCLRETT
jgi:Dna[CI] antecedent, DciA